MDLDEQAAVVDGDVGGRVQDRVEKRRRDGLFAQGGEEGPHGPIVFERSLL